LAEPRVRLWIPARAESIGEAREELGRFADLIGMAACRTGDLKTIVTEACNNAVLHAYEDATGIVEVEVDRTARAELEVVVRDFGCGIFPRPDSEVPSPRMGLPIIGALSTSFALQSTRGEGTVLRATLPLH
jgi:anti-sigma regulatory factor (Ser/Thr protein kinase)